MKLSKEEMESKYFIDEEGNPILKYNKKTMRKKSDKALRKGHQFFNYKGQQFAVLPKQINGN